MDEYMLTSWLKKMESMRDLYGKNVTYLGIGELSKGDWIDISQFKDPANLCEIINIDTKFKDSRLYGDSRSILSITVKSLDSQDSTIERYRWLGPSESRNFIGIKKLYCKNLVQAREQNSRPANDHTRPRKSSEMER